MEKELEEILEDVLELDYQVEDLNNLYAQINALKCRASAFLDSEFIQDIKKTFDFWIKYKYNDYIEMPTHTYFIKSFYDGSDALAFIDNHFDRLDIIISTVCSASKKAKAKKKEEEK